MKMRTMLPAVLAVFLAYGPLGAQPAADSAGLARAAATMIVDSVLPHLGDPLSAPVPATATAFDSAVAHLLAASPRVVPSTPRAGKYAWVMTRGFGMRGDSAAVALVTGDFAADVGPREIAGYVEQRVLLFRSTPDGWRYVGRQLVRGSHVGPPVTRAPAP